MLKFIRKNFHMASTGSVVEATLPHVDLTDSKLDPYSPTWLFIRTWAEEELDATREKNDYKKHDEIDTAMLRGRIKLLKDLLALPGTVKK